MSFPTPLSAFSFNEGSGNSAGSQYGTYALAPNNSATAWGVGQAGSGACAVGEFTGIIGTAQTTWTVQFDLYINSLSGWTSFIEINSNNLFFECDGLGAFDVSLGGTDGDANGTTLSTGTWHNIAVSHDNALNQTKIYHNGSLITTKNHTASTGTQQFNVSAEVCGSIAQPLNGKVDNIRLWNSVLTQAQIAEAATTPAELKASLLIWDGVSWFRPAARSWNGSVWVATTAHPLSPPAGSPTMTFPLLGGMLIGGSHNYDNTTYRQQIAKLDLAILGMYNGWNSGGSTPAQSVNAIKALNPNILLGNYTIMTETVNGSDPATQYRRDKLNSELGPGGVGDWWAYDKDGNHSDWSGGAFGTWDVNIPLFTTPDTNGDRWPQWTAKQDNTRMISNANFDIWYSDNNFWAPRVNDDWNRDGTNDDMTSETVRNWYRDGQRAYYDTAISLRPDLMLMVNTDNDLDGSVYPSEANPFNQYKNLMGGAWLEHAIGESWSVETWGGWTMMMGWYRQVMSNLLAPHVCGFDISMTDTTDYKSLRYAFASSLMDNGYFSASSDYGTVLWYDEFDLAGTSTTKWLGEAIDPPQTTPWQNGVYRRRFAAGVVLVNPKGNGSQTVSVGAGYHRFSGTQDSTTNNGAAASSVTLADRDGLFLVAN
jgi:hypothetical protein